MANKQRGEATIILNGNAFTMRPTFEAMCEIEDRLNTNLPRLISQFKMGDVSIKAIGTIVWAGIHGSTDGNYNVIPELASKPTLPEIGNMIRQTGFSGIIGDGIAEGENAVVNFLTRGLIGDAEADKAQEEAKKSQAVNPPQEK